MWHEQLDFLDFALTRLYAVKGEAFQSAKWLAQNNIDDFRAEIEAEHDVIVQEMTAKNALKFQMDRKERYIKEVPVHKQLEAILDFLDGDSKRLNEIKSKINLIKSEIPKK